MKSLHEEDINFLTCLLTVYYVYEADRSRMIELVAQMHVDLSVEHISRVIYLVRGFFT